MLVEHWSWSRGGEDGWLALAELMCAFQSAGLREERCSECCLIYYDARTRLPRRLYCAHTEILRIPTSSHAKQGQSKRGQTPPSVNKQQVFLTSTCSSVGTVRALKTQCPNVPPTSESEKGSTKFSHFADDTLMSLASQMIQICADCFSFSGG